MMLSCKHCSDVMKKHFNKEIIMTNKSMKILKTLLNIASAAMFYDQSINDQIKK